MSTGGGVPSGPRAIQIWPARVLALLLAVNLGIFGVYLVGRWAYFSLALGPVTGHLARLTDMGGEATIPTWFSIVQLLLAAALLGAIAFSVRAARASWWKSWFVLALVFAYISLDEQAEIHEILVLPLQQLLGITTGPFLLAWVIPALLALAALTIIYVPFLRALPRPILTVFLISAVIFVGGAAGMEMVDAMTYERLLGLGTRGAAIKSLLYGVEELLEMMGVSVFIYGLLLHLRDHVPRVTGVELSR